MTEPAPLLEARNVCRVAEDGTLLLHDITVRFPAGTSTALMGPPGSGKTLLLRGLGLLDPLQSGEILFRGRPIDDADVPASRRQIILLPQRPVLIEGTVRENLQLPFEFQSVSRQAYDETLVIDLLKQVGRDGTFLDQPSVTLSGGESQLVALLRAVQLQPLVLLLDEPTSSLDASTTDAVEHLIARWRAAADNHTLIVVTHTVPQAGRLAPRVIFMEQGRVIRDEENASEPA